MYGSNIGTLSVRVCVSTLSKMAKILGSSGLTLKCFPNDKFRLLQTESVCRLQFLFNVNGRKFSKWVENTVGKGEIAPYEQFLLCPQCFQKTFTADM